MHKYSYNVTNNKQISWNAQVPSGNKRTVGPLVDRKNRFSNENGAKKRKILGTVINTFSQNLFFNPKIKIHFELFINSLHISAESYPAIYEKNSRNLI